MFSSPSLMTVLSTTLSPLVKSFEMASSLNINAEKFKILGINLEEEELENLASLFGRKREAGRMSTPQK